MLLRYSLSVDNEIATLNAEIVFNNKELLVLPEGSPSTYPLQDSHIAMLSNPLRLVLLDAQTKAKPNALTVKDYPVLYKKLTQFVEFARNLLDKCVKDVAYTERAIIELSPTLKGELAAVVFALEALGEKEAVL